MASDETSGSESGVPGSRRRRPPSTIELEATEVANEVGPARDSAQSEPKPEPESAAHPGADEAEPDRHEPGARRGAGWGWIGGGLGGAAITILYCPDSRCV